MRPRHHHRRTGPPSPSSRRRGHFGRDGRFSPATGRGCRPGQRQFRSGLRLRPPVGRRQLRRGVRPPGDAAPVGPGSGAAGGPASAAPRRPGGGARLRLPHDGPRAGRAGHPALAAPPPRGSRGQRRRGRRRAVPARVGTRRRIRGPGRHDQHDHLRRRGGPRALGRDVGRAGDRQRLRAARRIRRIRHSRRPGGDLGRFPSLGREPQRLLGLPKRRGDRCGRSTSRLPRTSGGFASYRSTIPGSSFGASEAPPILLDLLASGSRRLPRRSRRWFPPCPRPWRDAAPRRGSGWHW